MDRSALGSVGAPQLRVVDREKHETIRASEKPVIGADVSDACRYHSVASPETEPGRGLGSEIDLVAERDHLKGERRARPRSQLGNQNGPGHGAVTLPQLLTVL